MADMESYESVLLIKHEVFVYKIPPRATNRGYRATDWNLEAPQWTGRMRLVAKGNECIMKLEDKTSGELFAKCPIEQYPGIALEAVTDSSRYFVVRIQDDDGRAAFIGLGFSDRSDSFDLNVALQDHFKWIKKSEEIEKEKDQDEGPKADFRFKEGETIKINMKITKKDGSEATSKPKTQRPSGMGGILPPPPGSAGKIAPPPKVTPTSSPSHSSTNPVPGMDFLNLGGPPSSSGAGASPTTSSAESWGDFTTARANPPPAQASPSNPNWVQF